MFFSGCDAMRRGAIPPSVLPKMALPESSACKTTTDHDPVIATAFDYRRIPFFLAPRVIFRPNPGGATGRPDVATQHRKPIKATPSPKSSELKFGIDRILGVSDKEADAKADLERKIADHESPETQPLCTYPPCPRLPHHYSLVCGTVYPPPPPRVPHSIIYSTPKHLPYQDSPTTHTSTTPSQQPAKRKRSWSRAVFSNLQRKGLEKRFEVQKYVTKPDRRQLAAILGLTDAQVKVWFQNRRMKWRHAQEAAKRKQEEECSDQSAERCDDDVIDVCEEEVTSHADGHTVQIVNSDVHSDIDN